MNEDEKELRLILRGAKGDLDLGIGFVFKDKPEEQNKEYFLHQAERLAANIWRSLEMKGAFDNGKN